MPVMAEAAVVTRFAERRALERLPTTLRGKVFPGALDCLITDYNAKGARLHFEGPPPSEDQIVLVIWSSGLAYEAQPRWRGEADMGVLFRSSCDFRGRTPAHLAAIRDEWRKRKPRIRRGEMMKSSAMIQKRRNPRDGWLG
jgi:hypothetical protein